MNKFIQWFAAMILGLILIGLALVTWGLARQLQRERVMLTRCMVGWEATLQVTDEAIKYVKCVGGEECR